MPSDPPDAPSLPSKSHIHRHCRTIRKDFNKIPHTKPELPAAPTLLFSACCFFFLSTVSVNLRSKCSEKEEKKRLEKNWGRWREGETKRKGKKKKKAQVENKTTQLVHLCHREPVKSPCVFVRVRVNKTLFEVELRHCTVASLRPLLSPCKNVPADYRKCYRIQS